MNPFNRQLLFLIFPKYIKLHLAETLPPNQAAPPTKLAVYPLKLAGDSPFNLVSGRPPKQVGDSPINLDDWSTCLPIWEEAFRPI